MSRHATRMPERRDRKAGRKFYPLLAEHRQVIIEAQESAEEPGWQGSELQR